jgi:hypothetical protein
MAKCRLTKEHRELADWAAQFGWSWEFTRSTHIRWTHPLVRDPVFSPHTPRSGESAKPRQKMRQAFKLATGRDMEAAHG